MELLRRDASLARRYETLRSYWSGEELRDMNVQAPPISEQADCADALGTRVSMLEMQHYMRNTLLRDCDGMSMAHSIELRVPFLDHQLAAYVVQNGLMGKGDKPLLIKACQDLLPASSVRRAKRGFVLPMQTWMRGPLATYVKEGLGALEASGALPDLPLKELHKRFERGALPWSRLWQFVVLGHWVENAIGNTQIAGETCAMKDGVVTRGAFTA
jgi:asparagine synthetase B (glutamine-hydrolysing)